MSDMLKIFKNGNMQSNNCIIYSKLSSSSSVCIVFFWQDTTIPVKPHNKVFKTFYDNDYDSLYCFDGSATLALWHDSMLENEFRSSNMERDL